MNKLAFKNQPVKIITENFNLPLFKNDDPTSLKGLINWLQEIGPLPEADFDFIDDPPAREFSL